MIITIIMIKYKPAYAVKLGENQIGYVNNRTSFQNKIDNEVLKSDEENVAFVTLDDVEYSFEFVNRNLINDDEVIEKVKENSKNIYSVYEVSDGNEEENVYVNTLTEAQELVDKLKTRNLF